ncbi:peptidoglycan-recognition protein LE [Tribolium castaneum]|uniref:Peptidoglycan-recognition protein LE-like Protein n=1 Tax=Tribolium castaneum TaxID=7070 RepID=D6WE12_TRICA|nr:PREDICTED: peptidoglycan-recognition protein LE [Tribolium castaneum]EFA01375.1 Peptidoglycan-recognition protein LE-like Protein [Tribolium castaneum]|eukprot:XP_968926.1 PREDICTED: peptidoglycan-recognition protein LE [Tribolium castaneum]
MATQSEDEKKNKVCQNYMKDENFNDSSFNKCGEILEKCNLSDSSSDYLSTLEENNEGNVLNIKSENVCFTNKMIATNNQLQQDFLTIDNILSKGPNQYNNIQIYKSQNVHIGDVTHINGPVYINHLTPTINQNIVINTNTNNDEDYPIVARRTWLAQPPLDPDDVKFFKKPPKFVIICHSASEEAYTQTDNNLLVRLIQQFHVESRKWNDISYNFLVGAEGSVYEGRGWKTVGAHTQGYNSVSIGICFIGCYIQNLPPSVALRKAKELIRYGVKIGAISEDYTLLGHCQCRSTESPGRRLFEEIKSWERWDGKISLENPSPLIE